MTKRILPLLVIAVGTLLWVSCNKKTEEFVYSEPSRGFYPLGIGHSILYEVDSTIWNDFNCTKSTRHLQMRYTVADTFTDNSGRPSYRIDVEERANADSNWLVSQVFYATPTGGGLDVVMQNVRMTKLIFPIVNGATWFGNRGIDTTDPNLRQYSGWVYRYSDYLQPYNNGYVNFDNTVTVTSVNDSLNNPETMPMAYAERNFMREVYAYDNKGLIYREYTHWTYDPGTAANACRKGFSVVMRATNFR